MGNDESERKYKVIGRGYIVYYVFCLKKSKLPVLSNVYFLHFKTLVTQICPNEMGKEKNFKKENSIKNCQVYTANLDHFHIF